MNNQESEAISQSIIRKPMTLAELAAWWEISEDEIKLLVRRKGVPYFLLTTADDRINWDKIRFHLEEVVSWQMENQERFRPRKDETLAPAPKATRLGNWRKSPVAG